MIGSFRVRTGMWLNGHRTFAQHEQDLGLICIITLPKRKRGVGDRNKEEENTRGGGRAVLDKCQDPVYVHFAPTHWKESVGGTEVVDQ